MGVSTMDKTFTREQIMEQVRFQEQYFESEIVIDTEEGNDTTCLRTTF